MFAPLDAQRPGQAPAWLVALEDVSAEYRRIRHESSVQFAGQLVSSVLLLTPLVLLISHLFGRMTRTAQAVPLLGQHAFEEARALLQPRARPVFADEIDRLDRAAVSLSLRLQRLESEARRHAGQLQEALRRVSSERDFNQSLLDTAQVVILTLDGAGHGAAQRARRGAAVSGSGRLQVRQRHQRPPDRRRLCCA